MYQLILKRLWFPSRRDKKYQNFWQQDFYTNSLQKQIYLSDYVKYICFQKLDISRISKYAVVWALDTF